MAAAKAPLPGTVCGGGVSGCRRWDDACAGRDSVPLNNLPCQCGPNLGRFSFFFLFCRGGFSLSHLRESLPVVSLVKT